MLVVRQIRLHNGAYCCVIPTTYFVHGERILPTAIRGQQVALRSRVYDIYELRLQSYRALQLVYRTHLKEKERKNKKDKSKKEMTRGSTKKKRSHVNGEARRPCRQERVVPRSSSLMPSTPSVKVACRRRQVWRHPTSTVVRGHRRLSLPAWVTAPSLRLGHVFRMNP